VAAAFQLFTHAAHSSALDYLRLRGLRRARDAFFMRAEGYFNIAAQIERLDDEPSVGRGSSIPMAAARCTRAVARRIVLRAVHEPSRRRWALHPR